MKIPREGNAYVFNVIGRKLYTKLSVKNVFSCTKWRIQDFPDGGGANLSRRGANLLFGNFFSENCIKILKIGRGRGRVPSTPPPTHRIRQRYIYCYWNSDHVISHSQDRYQLNGSQKNFSYWIIKPLKIPSSVK